MTNYNLYKTFLTVADCKNLTKASEILFISQPAITMNIKQLEETLGGKLFERKNKGVELTTFGILVYDKVTPPSSINLTVLKTWQCFKINLKLAICELAPILQTATL